MTPILAALSILATAPADLTTLLKAKDQALVDAIAVGDRAVWEATLAPEAIYADENGEISDRATLIKGLTPLPARVSGHIKVADDYRVEQVGDMAVAVFHLEESETWHGQELKARYLLTETWVRRGGQWKVLLFHAYAGLWEPPSMALPADQLDAYVGRYQAAPGVNYVIARDGDHLTGAREGKPATPLKIELADVMFVPDQLRVRKIFQRDGQGRVTGFVDRREGVDIVWRRLH